ncbi:hypothetical protein LXL04_038703 [Taraxacum kok-saghyz]
MSRIPELDHLQIPLEHIKLATNNFSDGNFIAKGGFGRVYKGQLPATISGRPGTTVAVKRLDVKGGQGQHEFLMEVVMLSSYKHDNLVSLVGFCDEGGEKILIYKHEARGSLDNYLAADLTWVQRLLICLGAARGLNYLHTGVGEGHRVLHRDIKSSNVLLDQNWEAKISDFGLSKIGPTNQDITFLVTNVAGTHGYVDPLYVATDVLTKESDVYSFGVVLFEMLCGRFAIGKFNDECRYLSQWVKLHYDDGKLDEIIFPSIRKHINPNSLLAFSGIAYQCLKMERKQRPTMAMIIEQLQISLELQIGCRRITRIGQWGSSTGGGAWSLQLGSNQKLKKITISHRNWIYSICFTTEDFSGSLDSVHRGLPVHHKTYKALTVSEVDFDDDEEIIGIDGTVGSNLGMQKSLTLITSLCFTTNKKRDGPFGQQIGTRFSVPWDLGSFAGFFGRSGLSLDALGIYLKSTR